MTQESSSDKSVFKISEEQTIAIAVRHNFFGLIKNRDHLLRFATGVVNRDDLLTRNFKHFDPIHKAAF
jgi:hypothetical protein